MRGILISGRPAPQVNWEFDHALRVYPLPDMLVLADRAGSAESNFEGCICANPGSLGADRTFATLLPVERKVELCDAPDE